MRSGLAYLSGILIDSRDGQPTQAFTLHSFFQEKNLVLQLAIKSASNGRLRVVEEKEEGAMSGNKSINDIQTVF